MTTDHCCKVTRVAATYGVPRSATTSESLEETLLARWQGRDSYREHGYRTLTEWFNRRLLARAYERAGRHVGETQLEAEFDVLTGADELEKLDLEDELAADGVDPDGVVGDMVSWSTMRGHLTGCLDAEKEREARTDWERNSISISRSQAREKIGEAVSSLGSKGTVQGADDAEVSIDVALHCDRCAASVPLVVALDRGYVCETHHRPSDP